MPASVHVATVPAMPKSTSSGWATITRIRATSVLSSTLCIVRRPGRAPPTRTGQPAQEQRGRPAVALPAAWRPAQEQRGRPAVAPPAAGRQCKNNVAALLSLHQQLGAHVVAGLVQSSADITCLTRV